MTEMTEQLQATGADQALKAKHRAMWALGDYPAAVSPDPMLTGPPWGDLTNLRVNAGAAQELSHNGQDMRPRTTKHAWTRLVRFSGGGNGTTTSRWC